MRAFLVVCVLTVFGFSLCDPAEAYDRDREEFLSRTHWQCERGDHESCRIYHIYRQCHEGNLRACEEIERYHYHDHWHERDHSHEHERNHEGERWNR